MVTLYGFRSCDTVRKAQAWLDAHGVAHDFFDYRLRPLDRDTVASWFARAGWEAVFNRNSATFRDLPEDEKRDLDEARALEMILPQTNFIKRPVLDLGDRVLPGFTPAAYEQAFAQPE